MRMYHRVGMIASISGLIGFIYIQSCPSVYRCKYSSKAAEIRNPYYLIDLLLSHPPRAFANGRGVIFFPSGYKQSEVGSNFAITLLPPLNTAGTYSSSCGFSECRILQARKPAWATCV